VQSCRRAVPRRQQQQHTSLHVATCDRDTFHNRVTLTFDLIFLAALAAVMDYICSNFGVGSSSRFPFRARTHRDTKSQTQLSAYTHGSLKRIGQNITTMSTVLYTFGVTCLLWTVKCEILYTCSLIVVVICNDKRSLKHRQRRKQPLLHLLTEQGPAVTVSSLKLKS